LLPSDLTILPVNPIAVLEGDLIRDRGTGDEEKKNRENCFSHNRNASVFTTVIGESSNVPR
jgi:hypothetical protein